MALAVDLRTLPPAQLKALARWTTPRLTKYIPHQPHPKQAAFLLTDQLEVFYGGAGGGGKSDALIMGALQFVDVPGYSALLLRKSFADLSKPGALMPRLESWLEKTDAHWVRETKTWEFPTGGEPARVTFGYVQNYRDVQQYRGAEYQFVGWDELTQHEERTYRFLFSRVRRLEGSQVPIRIRSASNPGDVGHEWVKRRFIEEGRQRGRIFIPAKIADNPSLDREEYERSLAELDPVTRAQILDGSWDILPEGGRFKRAWFRIVQDAPASKRLRVARFWDLAATISQTSAYTCGVKLGLLDGAYYLLDVVRLRCTPDEAKRVVRQTAELDGRTCPVHIEQEPGSGGIYTINQYRRDVLVGFTVKAHKPHASKIARSAPFASAAEAGNFLMVNTGRYSIADYLDETTSFPQSAFKDQVDATSGCIEALTTGRGGHLYSLDDLADEEEDTAGDEDALDDDEEEEDWR